MKFTVSSFLALAFVSACYAQTWNASTEVVPVANDGNIGTTLNLLAKLNATGQAVRPSTSDRNGILGIVAQHAGTSGAAGIAVSGQAYCSFDGGTTAGDYVQASSISAGFCHDAGGTFPASGTVVGRVLSTSSVTGFYSIFVFPAEMRGSSGGGGGGSAAVWGSITGNLSDQSDIIAALAATGTVTSFSVASAPSWLVTSIANPTSTPTLTVSAATGQTSHQVIGTCGSATSFVPCSLALGDLPTGYPYSSLTGAPSLFNQTLQVGGTPATQRANINFVAGANVTLSQADNGTDTTALTINAAAPGTGTVTSFATPTVPSWLSASVSSPTTVPALTLSAASTQTSHQVIGTCGTATAFAPCLLVAGDIPVLNQSTTGSAATFAGALSGDVTGNQSSTVVGKINGTSLASLGTGILKNTTTTGVPSIAASGDFPTLNQSTTGNALTATTATNLAAGLIGSLPYQSAASTTLFLAGNTAATDQVYVSHGSGSAALAPALSNAPALSAANMTGFPATLMTTSTVLGSSQMPALTGDVTNTGLATTVGKIGGKTVSLSGNFTTTGSFNPTIAIPSSSTWTFPAGPSTLMSTATVLGSSQMPTFTGDVSNSGLALTVGSIGGKTVSLSGNLTTTGAFNPTIAVPSSSTWTLPAGPSTLMSTATVLASAQMPTLTGDATNSGLAMTVSKINGTSLAGLATGILKNTTTTGIPSIAIAADFPTLNQNTSGTAANVTGLVAVANGGTGTATPGLVNGTNVTITGAWPNQTVNATTTGGSMTWPAAAGITVYAGGNAWGASLTAPTGAIVGTTDTQVLTNKTLDGVSSATMAFVDPSSSIQTQLNGKQASGAYLTGNQTITLSGDTTGSGATAITTTTAAVNGTTVPVNSAADQTIVTTASAAGAWKSLPSCLDSAGNHLNYNTSTHVFSCGTSGSGGTTTFSALTGSTNTTAAMVVGAGGSLAPTSATAGVVSANQINGTALSGLATGIVKNTTTTGIPSIAIAGDFPTLNQSTTGNALTSTTATNIAGGLLGTIPYQSAASTTALLAGNTAATDQVLVSHGTGSVSAVPTLSNAPALSATNLTSFPTLNQNTTGSAVSFTGSLVGDVTGTQGATVVGKINGTSMAGLATGIVKNTTTTGVPSIAIAGDFPTLNQSTTGNATTATTATNLSGGALGSIPYQSAAATTAILAGNTAATDQVLVSHGTGAVSAIPTFGNAPALSAANMTSFPATLMTTSTVTTAAQEPAHTGDVTNTAGSLAMTVGAIGGKTVTLSGNLTTTGAFNPTLAIPSSSTWTFPAGPSTLMSTATVLASGQMPTFTGDVTNSGLAMTVGKINGASMAGLATGILKNTTTTGVPSIAIAADFPTLNQSTTGTAANVTGNVAIANGGSGQTTATAAFGALAPAATRAGDVLYWNGSAYSTLAGNNSGTNFFQENASGVPSWAAGSSSIAWGAISNPTGNLALTMGSNTSAFNYTTALANAFSWSNTTAAIVGTSQASPPLALCGTGFHASASVTDCLTLQNTPGAGNDAAITFAIGHTGTSTGLVTTTFPGPIQAGASGGVGGTLSLPEGTAASAATANDICYADSTLHGAKCSYNNGSFLNLPLETGTMTAGDLVSVNATTNLLADSGVVAANAVTAAGTLTSNAVMLGGGTKAASTIAADTTTTHALFATAGAPAFRALAAGDIPASLTSTTSVNSTTIPSSATLMTTGTVIGSAQMPTFTGDVSNSGLAMTVGSIGGKTVSLSGNLTTTGAFNPTLSIPSSSTWTFPAGPSTLMSTATVLASAQMPTFTGDVSNSGLALTVGSIGGKTVTLSGNLTTTGAFNPTFSIPASTTWTFPAGPSTLMSTATVLASGQMPTLTGDVSNSELATTVGSIGGKTVTLSGNLTTTGAFNPTFAIPSSSTWTFPAGPSTLMSTGTSVLAAQMPALTGDVTTSAGAVATTAVKINGTSVPTNAAGDQVILTTASATGSWGAVPACLDSAGNHLNYSTVSHAFSCGTSSSGGTTTFSSLTGSTNTTAAMVVGSGATLAPTSASAGVISANQINGTALGGLATGILKNTTTTGVPSIAVAGDFPTLNQNSTGTSNLAGGALGSLPYQSAAATTAVIAGNTAATDQVLISHGTGTVSAIPTLSNAPALSATNMTSFPASLMTTSTVLGSSQMPVFTGDVTNSGLAMTVGKIGGKTVSLSGNFTTTGAFNPTFSIPSSSTWTFPAGPSTLMSTATVLGSSQMPVFTGDVTNSGLAMTAVEINGTTVPTNAAADQVILTTASATGSWAAVTPCLDSAGNHLNYNSTTHAFLCGSTSSSGTPTFSAITGSTNTTATMVVGSGASIAAAGAATGTVDANSINGTNLSFLASGILRSATSTGVVTIATAGQFPTLNQSTTGNAATATRATNIAGGLLGTLPYQSAVNTTALLAGNTTSATQYLTQTGTGTVSAIPAWGAIAAADVPAALSSTTSVNGTTIPSSSTLTRTIASGTSTMGTTLIATTACATVVTTSATGTLSTDAFTWSNNLDVSGVTGYTPATAGSLRIYAYPTTDNVNFKVCNPTTSSITPGAITLNWRVTR